MSNKIAVAWLALAVIIGALIAGFVPVHVNDASCGSAFNADDSDAITAQFGANLDDIYAGRTPGSTVDYKAACADRRGTQMAFVIPLLIVSVLGGGFLLLTAQRTESATPTAPRTSA
jgi:hypothetical protein